MPINNSYQDRIRIAPAGLVGPLDRNQNQTVFHPMVRTNWEIVDHIRGVLGAYVLEYPGSAGNAFWNAGSVLYAVGSSGPVAGQGARLSTGAAVANEFVGDNDGTNIVFDYSLASNQSHMTLTFSNAGWKSYEVSDGARFWFDQPADTLLYNTTASIDKVKDRLNSYVGTSIGPSTAMGLLWGSTATGPFFDHTALLYLPSPNAAIRSKAGTMFNVEPTYVQYVDSVPNYEQTIAPDAVAEHILPNAYYLQFELENTGSTLLAGGRYKDALSLFNQAVPLGPSGEDRRWFTTTTNNGYTESNIGRFYEIYAQALAATDASAMADSIQRDLMVLYRDRDTLTEDVINQGGIPFYNKITIPSEGAPTLAAATYGSPESPPNPDVIDILQYRAVQGLVNPTANDNFRVATKTITSAGQTPDFINSVSSAEYNGLQDVSSLIADASSFINDINEIAVNIENDNEVPNSSIIALHRRGLANTPAAIDIDQDIYDAVDIFETQAFSHYRNFQQILTNQSCHTETLMFVVKKYRGDSDTPAQTFYFTNRFDGQDIIFYDSQIKTKQRYRYTFERVMLIFGNEYSYAFPDGNDINFEYTAFSGTGFHAQLGITNLPNIKTCLVPYVAGDIVTMVEDKPPIVPEISFYPFRGVNNQVKILLHASIGITNEKPIAILEEDKSFFADEYLAQTGLPASYDNIETIEFRSDDPVDAYMLFRLTTKPSSYRDFESGTEISIDPDRGIPGSFTDAIRPNTKYYYCARAVDVNGNISNPTHIFEIEMIDNAGQIFLRQDIIQFESSQIEYTKTGQRYIYIEPSMLQLALEDASLAGPSPSPEIQPNNSILGPMGTNTGVDKVWEKTFKIRTTSKKTGRKLDLNVTFKNTGIVNPSE